MSEHKYSIQEIDSMRESIRWMYPDGVPYYETERAADIENRLRTYMQNGTRPEELHEQVSKMLAARQQQP